ncbi:MAG: YmdB family metallophosphoesterase [Armatimonadetes bacterium]|nr:YmdB family metallophosphoesterase [Armatimonadota bacterium]MDE2207603.1 YmdB family metallophosphoesterase [Armatimonadota bacterium]
MRLLMVGDITGRPGRDWAIELAPALRQRLHLQAVVMNAENAAAGLGITPAIADSLLAPDVADVLTLGNHAFARREICEYLKYEPRILRPANYPPDTPGRGMGIYSLPCGTLAVISLLGRTFMEAVDCPFRTGDELLNKAREITNVVLCDFHAEATSEKKAFGWHADGRVGAVLGTHTHVQTADEQILPNGTAFMSDVGMTGPKWSVIGVQSDLVVQRFITGMPVRYETAMAPAELCGAVVDIEQNTGRAASIWRLRVTNAAGAPRVMLGPRAQPEDME